jgi:NCS1 family nucleobase:cation symporter-1
MSEGAKDNDGVEPGLSHTGVALLDETIELHNIDHIPESERHGRSWSQFTIWFSAQLYLASIVLGAIGISIGLGLWQTLGALVAANILGSLATAACATMGPRLGIAQLPMSRASFGYYGNFVPAILATLLFIGYFSVGTILGAQVIQAMWHVPYWTMAVLVAVFCVVVAVLGHDKVHRWGHWVSAIAGIVFVILTVLAFAHGYGAGAATTVHGSELWKAWLLEFTIAFSFTFSWAPYASDYSRYLPKKTPSRHTFLFSFAGLFVGTTWMMFLGALLASIVVNGNTIPAIAVVSGGFRYAAYVAILGGTLVANVLNLYSGAMSSLTWNFPLARWKTVVVIGAAGLVLSLAFGGDQFTHYYDEFLFFVAYFVTPWLAIILLDFYRFRHAYRSGYEVAPVEFYKHDGIFGRVSWTAIISFFVAFAVSVPFMATILYTGPIGKALGGADLSYFVSFVVAGIFYFALESWRRGKAASPLLVE